MIVSEVGRTTSGSSSADVGSTAMASLPCLPVARSRVCVTSATSLANPSTCSASLARKLIGMNRGKYAFLCRGLDQVVQRALHQLPDAVAVGANDHAAAHRRVIR